MRLALSTNWCNRRISSGEEIADEAVKLGFDALELGFLTTPEQVKGFKARLDRMPVTSVHAFCPVPVSAPEGYPELYALASRVADDRAIARVHILKNVRFAAEMGATALVLHAGRVPFTGPFARLNAWRRIRHGRKMTDLFKRELEKLVPELEAKGVKLGLENLPSLDGYPAEWEYADVCGPWVRPWLDTGHDFVRMKNGWKTLAGEITPVPPLGLHVNDSKGGDDHLAPGSGQIDFAALKPIACAAEHLVFEPNPGVRATELKNALARIRTLWS